MLALRRRAVLSARQLRTGRARYSGQHGKEGDHVQHFAGSSTEHGHHHAGPANESLGPQFYFVLALIPASFALYAASRTSKDGSIPGFSKVIQKYSDFKEKWVARNTLHTAMIEQAAFDRNLYQSSPGSRHVNLKFPEIFNTGSPYNVSAGQGGANLEKLVAHYEQLNLEAEEKKAQAVAAKESK
ncbi:MAG: hypothetical protein M1818_000778 [Claussenomyces sp. TS43310]|nr:MAG: hypothetical protein M1818_000778 [Claussenomyces sp. TS43310]